MKIKKKGWMFVLPWSPHAIGGVSTVINELCKELNRQEDYQPYVLVEDWKVKKPVISYQRDYIEIRLRIRSISTSMGRERLSYFIHLPQTLFRLRHILKKYNITVINVHYPRLTSMTYALIKLFKRRISFLLSFHGSDLAGIEKTPQCFAMWRFIMKRADLIASCSAGLSKNLSKTFPEIAGYSQYIYSGISQTFIEQSGETREHGKTENLPPKYILSVGTFEHQKGQDLLINAFSLVASQFTDIDLVLVGRTSTELNSYKQLALKLGLAGRVYFYENISHVQINDFYQKAILYVSASRNEAFGLVMLEAAAFKVPVIATKTIGACEIIENNVDGQLVEINDYLAIAEKIKNLLNDKTQRQKLAKSLYNKAMFEFTWTATLEKYKSFIE